MPLKKKHHIILLMLLWACAQGWILYTNGIRTDLEAAKYMGQAKIFLNSGTFSSNNFWFYSVEIFLISFFIKFKIGFAGLVVLQMLLNLLATYIFYKFIKFRYDDATAFITTLLLILNIPFNQYNAFLQTESIYHSLLIIYTVYLLSIEKFSKKNIAVIIFYLLLLTFTRPAALFLYPCTIIYFLYRISLKKYIKFIIGSALFFISIIILNAIMQSGGELNFLLPFEKDMIICGVAENNHVIQIAQPNNIAGIAHYILQNPVKFLYLGLKKTISFFGVYRSYYSAFHNLYLLILFLPLYFFSVTGLKYKFKKDIIIFCLSFIIITWLSIFITCDDWHNRFLLTTFPCLLILAANGLKIVIARLTH